MSNERKESGPEQESPVTPQVEKEIPSVVTNKPAKNKLFLIGFVGVLGVLVYFVLAGKNEPTDKKTARFESAAGIQGIPADLQEKMDALAKGLPPPGSASGRLGERPLQNAADALEEARRHAPTVVYNQRTAGSASNGGKTNAGAAPTASATGSGSSNSATAQAGTNVMPASVNVAFSNAPTASATIMGNRDFIVGQGKLVDGVLETAINSDQPGMVRALVNVDIYGDSGRAVLLPRGTRIVGRYDAGIVKGQTRVFIVWQRVMRPDGVDLAIESPGTDVLGRAGMGGDVDNHFWQMFGAATLLSVIGAETATAGVNPTRDQNNSVASLRQSAAESFNRSAGSVLDRYIDIKPTITVNQGSVIKIFVSKDLIFDPSLQAGSAPQVIR
jgi:type IV secretion system protein VirB10